MNNDIESKATLSPPWYEMSNRIRACFSLDNDVQADAYDKETSKVVLHVSKTEKAIALANLLLEEHVFGNVTLKVEIQDNDGNIVPPQRFQYTNVEQIKDLADKAFTGNERIIEIQSANIAHRKTSAVILVVKKSVIQFYNDDLSDFYLNANIVASNAFYSIIVRLWSDCIELTATSELNRDI